MTERDEGRRLTRRGLRISGLGLAGLAAVYLVALRYTPVERFQGLPQKIFYLHVPAAWSALLAFSLVGIAGALYLWLRDPRLDLFAESIAEAGLVFSCVMLTTGPLWGKPVWGTWWTWDARLTLTLMLFFLFLGYRVLRGAIQEPGERARFSAVVGILGMVLVPFVHLTGGIRREDCIGILGIDAGHQETNFDARVVAELVCVVAVCIDRTRVAFTVVVDF